MVYLDPSHIKNLALSVGFDKCGICRAVVPKSNIFFFENWLKRGYNAEMKYLSENKDIRYNPSKLLANARSVISVLLNYNIENTFENKNFSISKYAIVSDYHTIMHKKLDELSGKIKADFPDINMRVFTDTAPILERYYAMSAGLGFIGKNSCLINNKYGSWVFIGEIITDAEFDFYDSPIPINCGECNKCIQSCPCGALSENGLNANKCISYHTIENKSAIPGNIVAKITDQLFGCDICQEVCPYNSQPDMQKSELPCIEDTLKTLDPDSLENISNREFNRHFVNTSLLRAGRKKILENFSHLKISKDTLI